MFSVSLQEQQYKTYILSDSAAESQMEVLPERGGIITKWQIRGEEIFYLDVERLTHPDLSVRGGVPILFPICGNLPDNSYTHNGTQYNLKQHGFARDLPWEVSHQSIEDGASLTVVLKSNDETRAVYPFDFEVAFTYLLKGNTLEIQQRYTNLSQERMPFANGFHPYFAVADKTKLQIEIPASQYIEKGGTSFHPFDGTFDWESPEIDIALQPLTSNTATVTDSSRQLKLSLSYDDNYSTLVFWTVKDKDFYCLEPWSSPRNALNTGEHLLYVEPGASRETLIKLTANFLKK